MNENGSTIERSIQIVLLTNSIIMLIGLPFFADVLNITIFSAILGILIIGVLVGLTTHRNRVVMFLNIIVSIVGAFAFEYTAVQSRALFSYFAFNQLVAVFFFIAIVLSIKGFREIYWTMR